MTESTTTDALASEDFVDDRDAFYWTIAWTSNIGAVFGILICIFFIHVFRSSKPSDLKSAYFMIWTLAQAEDAIVNLMWMAGDMINYNEDHWLIYPVYFCIWYCTYFVAISDFVLAMNRFTAFTMPFFHQRFWDKTKTEITICVLIVLFPCIVDARTFFLFDCRFYRNKFTDSCVDYTTFDAIFNIVVTSTLGFLSLILILVGLTKYKNFDLTKKSASLEKRLILQILSTTIFQTGNRAFTAINNLSGIQIYLSIANVLYLVDHFSQILILFVVSYEFRTRFCEFYHLPLFAPSETDAPNQSSNKFFWDKIFHFRTFKKSPSSSSVSPPSSLASSSQSQVELVAVVRHR